MGSEIEGWPTKVAVNLAGLAPHNVLSSVEDLPWQLDSWNYGIEGLDLPFQDAGPGCFSACSADRKLGNWASGTTAGCFQSATGGLQAEVGPGTARPCGGPQRTWPRLLRGPRPRHFAKHTCQVDGCPSDLSCTSYYYQRNHICPEHLKQESIIVRGIPSRFCQRCGVSHDLASFDGQRKSCRHALARHKMRRLNKLAAAGMQFQEPGPAGAPTFQQAPLGHWDSGSYRGPSMSGTLPLAATPQSDASAAPLLTASMPTTPSGLSRVCTAGALMPAAAASPRPPPPLSRGSSMGNGSSSEGLCSLHAAPPCTGEPAEQLFWDIPGPPMELQLLDDDDILAVLGPDPLGELEGLTAHIPEGTREAPGGQETPAAECRPGLQLTASADANAGAAAAADNGLGGTFNSAAPAPGSHVAARACCQPPPQQQQPQQQQPKPPAQQQRDQGWGQPVQQGQQEQQLAHFCPVLLLPGPGGGHTLPACTAFALQWAVPPCPAAGRQADTAPQIGAAVPPADGAGLLGFTMGQPASQSLCGQAGACAPKSSAGWVVLLQPAQLPLVALGSR